ncbi:MAG: hypothetical protein LWX02_08290 [Deltaproteobacteria bacterium]|jgi:hypothetical protein|nr:hypothetical protein [Desulfobacterales bacterium]MDL1981453.1 hypothetical protein [Deltaproteobacteria bacterium]MDL1988134.1 hypothetical protein [Deltaproteobacteria bacterium]MDL2124053.1 hypothetical protein [Deltaproteobacteria bacterium]
MDKVLLFLSSIRWSEARLDPEKISVKPVLNPASLKIALGSKDRISIDYVVKERLQ